MAYRDGRGERYKAAQGLGVTRRKAQRASVRPGFVFCGECEMERPRSLFGAHHYWCTVCRSVKLRERVEAERAKLTNRVDMSNPFVALAAMKIPK